MPPEGEYRSGPQVLVAQGKGRWNWETRFPDGKVSRRMPLAGDRLQGAAEGFYANGKPAFRANYQEGELEGEAVQFDEAGEETRRQFKGGEAVEE